MQKIKNEKGITLIALAITIVVLGLIAVPTVIKTEEVIELDKFTDFKDDLTNLRETVQIALDDENTSEVGPLYTGSTSFLSKRQYNQESQEVDVKNPNDDDKYYVISVSKLNSLLNSKTGIKMEELNYGENNYDIPNSTTTMSGTDMYIINNKSKTIYYPDGYTYQGRTYYRYPENFTEIVIPKYIGKYVDYEPDEATYSQNLLGVNYTGSTSNTSDFTTAEYRDGWQILDYNEITGEMIIIMAQPTKSLFFEGARAYNNGVDILNDMCAKLFSSNEWGVTARSEKIEDVEDRFNEKGIEEISKYVSQRDNLTKYNYTKSYNTNTNFPILYEQEIGSGTDGTGTVKTTGLKVSENNKNGIDTSSTIQYSQAPTTLAITQTYYWLKWDKDYFKDEDYLLKIFRTSDNWLASRLVDADQNSACFGLRRVTNSAITGYNIYRSYNGEDGCNIGLRAVVELGTGIKVGNESGEDIEHAITISK